MPVLNLQLQNYVYAAVAGIVLLLRREALAQCYMRVLWKQCNEMAKNRLEEEGEERNNGKAVLRYSLFVENN